MPANTRQPPRQQPLHGYLRRSQKAGHVLAGNEKSKNQKPSTKSSIDKGKGKAEENQEDSNSSMDVDADSNIITPSRVSTPPPRNRNENDQSSSSELAASTTGNTTFATPRTPPRTPKPRSRTATLPDLDLLEPLQRSPVSVRTDPDTGKMFLLLPNNGGSPNLGGNTSTSRSKIASTPPSRRLFSNELASAEAKELNTPIKSLADSFSDSTEDQSRPSKKFKSSKSIIKGEEGDENPFVSNSPSIQSKRFQPNFIHPLSSSTKQLHGSRTLPLPSHHSTLFGLYSALEHALVVHLALWGTAGSTIEESSTTSKNGSTSILEIPQLISFSALRPLVERSSGRRFGKNELARLLWLCGASDPVENDSAYPSPQPNIGFSITKAKTTDKTGRRHVELMLGIRIPNNEDGQWNDDVTGGEDDHVDFDDQDELKIAQSSSSSQRTPQIHHTLPITPRSQTRALGIAAPQSPSPSPRFTRTPIGGGGGLNGTPITPPLSPLQSGRSSRHIRFNSGDLSLTPSSPSSSSTYVQRSQSIVGLWNLGLEQRKRIVRKRLLRWCLTCLDSWRQTQGDSKDSDIKKEQSQLKGLGIQSEEQNNVTSSSDQMSTVYADNYVFNWDPNFPLERVAPIPMAQLPSIELEQSSSILSSSSMPPKKSKLELVRDAHQNAIAKSEEALGKKLTLKERIQAKEQAAARITAGMKRSRTEEIQQSTSASSVASIARQKSALSRLENVAESTYMLFVSSSSNNLGGVGQRKSNKFSPLPLQDVIKAVCSGSKQIMGNLEARQSLIQLQSIVPGFIEIEKIGMLDWVKLIGNVKIDEEQQPQQHGSGGVLAAVRKLVKLEMQRLDA